MGYNNNFNDITALTIYGEASIINSKTFSQNASFSVQKLKQIIFNESSNSRVVNFFGYFVSNEIRMRRFNVNSHSNKECDDICPLFHQRLPLQRPFQCHFGFRKYLHFKIEVHTFYKQ